jgi:hypothetical protein
MQILTFPILRLTSLCETPKAPIKTGALTTTFVYQRLNILKECE